MEHGHLKCKFSQKHFSCFLLVVFFLIKVASIRSNHTLCGSFSCQNGGSNCYTADHFATRPFLMGNIIGIFGIANSLGQILAKKQGRLGALDLFVVVHSE